jgi:4-hydroxy-tetrahydrodipicolinate synthase
MTTTPPTSADRPATAADRPSGLWLPLITPMRDGFVDEPALRALLRHYLAAPVDGFIVAATTGEGLTLDADEVHRLVALAAETVAGARPLWLGLAGSDTRRLVATLRAIRTWPVDGTLISCPSYTRPSQEGLRLHFTALAEHATRPIMVYNIPYRTGVNMANETLLRLAELDRIVGVKDCCASPAQSVELLRHRPDGFAVLAGDDAQFFTALAHGADGGILASAHVDPAGFAAVRAALAAGDRTAALAAWGGLLDLIGLLFAEPNPAPVKHWLWRRGLLPSPELRLPLTPVSPGLAARLDAALTAGGAAGARRSAA